jgi:alkanesulfonate monooxygenase SsuD/methylene tetrahydromethanopterin reductase-like flavin-dependent oxidoreductase (luciferase family)
MTDLDRLGFYTLAGFDGALDDKATSDELEHVATLIPDEWLAPDAIGSAERCAEKVREQFDLGPDGVILHGAAPADLEPIVQVIARSIATT